MTAAPAVLLFLGSIAVAGGEKVRIDLQTGNITGSISKENGLEWIVKPPANTSCIRRTCDLRGVLKLTFNSSRKMAKIDMKLAMSARGWTFHVGDSESNNGYGGDDGDQSNDAEVHSVNDTIFVYSKEGGSIDLDDSSSLSHEQLHVESKFVKTDVSLKIADEFTSLDNGDRLFLMDSPKLFALNAQPDFQGPVNYDVYLGMNRVVASPVRSGEGLCSVEITFPAEE